MSLSFLVRLAKLVAAFFVLLVSLGIFELGSVTHKFGNQNTDFGLIEAIMGDDGSNDKVGVGGSIFGLGGFFGCWGGSFGSFGSFARPLPWLVVGVTGLLCVSGRR